jgi:small subunit ribosomal protein S20
LPHHKSCIKRLRTSGEERVRNNALKTLLRKTLKDARAKLDEGESVDLKQIYANIDRVCSKGAIPKNRASRLKSRLTKAAAKKTATKS